MTLVTKTTSTWPTVPTRRITLTDTNCKPQEAHDTRILFSFGLNTCGTKFMVLFYEPICLQCTTVLTDELSQMFCCVCLMSFRLETLMLSMKMRLYLLNSTFQRATQSLQGTLNSGNHYSIFIQWHLEN